LSRFLTKQTFFILRLELYRNTPNLHLLVGGGDGTVGWILSVIDQINFISQPPPVAVLPLGTGNDMSRLLHWGSKYTDEPLTKILHKILNSRCVKLDRWKINTEPNSNCEHAKDEEQPLTANSDNPSKASSHQPYEKLKVDVMNNYFGIGADAQAMLDFHEKRGLYRYN
jgi:diacylglycerol kinase (ATP)